MQGVQLSLLRFRRQMKNPEDLLRERGIRPTELRKEVLRILFGAGRPLSWKDTFTRFTEKRVNKVSLYRTLSLLEEKGLVHKILGTDGAWHYCAHLVEGKKCPGNHPHFLCLACGRMFCLEDQPLPTVQVPEGCVVEGKQLLAYGRCPSCSGTQPQG
ncbi:MAG: Fur family transcriptional regulator [Aminobacteriaceae bacterium]|nr:transcriptional repressor [Aminivibrio sp.]MDD3514477.1 transcriptional repressor [Synergistaceae bacterium]MEA4953812.1 transcriptional repressor [Aminivibrio sp.]